MPEESGNIEAQRFGVGVPIQEEPFYVKGSNHLDWGMQDRLSRMFNPKSGKTVMLAFDHGYIMGPTSGLERMDLTMRPLVPHSDVIMCTRGALRATIPPVFNKPVSLRVTAGSTVLVGDDLFNECIGVDIEEAVRLNATIMAVQVCIGGKYEHVTIRDLVQVVDAGNKFGIPTLGVTAVGREMARDARYLGMASRVLAELGAHVIKTYFCEEGFERVTAGCPVPVVIAGGKKLPELDAMTMCYKAIDQGADGVDMGRNIFQADDPVAMIRAIRAIVHEGEKPEKALELYETLKSENQQ